MREIRKIKPDHIRDLVKIEQQAYTARQAESVDDIDKIVEKYEKMFKEAKGFHYFGLFENQQLLGSMKLYDFKMNVFGQFLPLGGLGNVAVDLLHKKEKIAKDLVTYYLDHYVNQGYALTALYPFRPDFYYRMGFGYGKKKDLYKVVPEAFPNFKNKNDLTYLGKEDSQAVVDCYNTFASNHHGLFYSDGPHFDAYLESFKSKVIGIKKKGKLTGFAVFTFQNRSDDHFLSNDIQIHQLVYNDTDALKQLMTFFHTQKDQVNRINIATQDSSFNHLLSDARNDSNNLIPPIFHETNQSGTGIMYRIINVKKFFQQLGKHNFNGVTTSITFNVRDSFYPKNEGPVTITFNNGNPIVTQGANAKMTIDLDIADLTSLVLGVIDFRKLYLYGLTKISDEAYVEEVTNLFATAEGPICTTGF
ncbi:GNAT family N-acetyltransferase [Piscibacillus sp. B03]|uniref:GNAT family N-acetyltransferase n=1 Tax=Piscibacillus sp. B03 TaxID=3457430 RepID=UPI003FCE3FA3